MGQVDKELVKELTAAKRVTRQLRLRTGEKGRREFLNSPSPLNSLPFEFPKGVMKAGGWRRIPKI